MFRVNRIGTPVIHALVGNTVVNADYTMAHSAVYSGNLFGNCINAVPQLDFGENKLSWLVAAVAPSLAANEMTALLQTFTVTEPIQGDTVGMELNASLVIATPPGVLLVPVFCRLAAAPNAVLNGCQSDSGGYTFMGAAQPPDVATETLRSHSYTKQVIANGAVGAIAGVYAHGFAIINDIGIAASWGIFAMQASVRQLNDQQSVGYRDTRK